MADKERIPITQSIYYYREAPKDASARRTSHSQTPTKFLNKQDTLSKYRPEAHRPSLAAFDNNVYVFCSPVRYTTPCLASHKLHAPYLHRNKSNLLKPTVKPSVLKKPTQYASQKSPQLPERNCYSAKLIQTYNGTSVAPFGQENSANQNQVEYISEKIPNNHKPTITTAKPDSINFSKIASESPSFSNILDQFRCSQSSQNKDRVQKKQSPLPLTSQQKNTLQAQLQAIYKGCFKISKFQA